MLLRFTSKVTTAAVLTCVAMGIALTAPTAEAAKVEKVKGKRVLVDSEGDALSVGQVYSVRDSSGKSVGLIKITKVGSARAVAVLGKGSARPGQNIQLRQKSSSSAQRARKSSPSAPPSSSASYIGGMAGVSMAKADVDLFDAGGNSTGSVSLDGNGFSAKGLYDYPLFTSVGFRGLLGLEQFNVAGGSNTACSGKCETEITYLTFDFWARFILSQGTTRPWVGAGGSLLFPVSKSSSALKESSITNTNIFAFGGGIDFFLSGKTYIPVQIEYDMYPKSDTVKASAIAIRGGFAVEY